VSRFSLEDVANLDHSRYGIDIFREASRRIYDWPNVSDADQPLALPSLVDQNGNPISSLSRKSATIITEIKEINQDLIARIKADPEMMHNLPSRMFEELVAKLLQQLGYEVELTPAIKDGGFDMYAAKKDALGSFLFLVECKRYSAKNRVGVEIVRSLHGVVQSMKATAGIVATTSYFTAGAKEFQRENRHQLQLRDYTALQEWLARVGIGIGPDSGSAVLIP
jgi:restriction system protein